MQVALSVGKQRWSQLLDCFNSAPCLVTTCQGKPSYGSREELIGYIATPNSEDSIIQVFTRVSGAVLGPTVGLLIEAKYTFIRTSRCRNHLRLSEDARSSQPLVFYVDIQWVKRDKLKLYTQLRFPIVLPLPKVNSTACLRLIQIWMWHNCITWSMYL